MFDSLLALSELQLDSREFTRARVSLDEALSTAQSLQAESKPSLYPEWCIALASQKLGDYHSLLASSGLMRERAGHLAAAEQWYGRAAEVWSKWRRQDLAMPYALNREKEVAGALARMKRAVPVIELRR